MFTVYIIRNSLTNRHYIGSTNDFVRRLQEHNRGQTTSTRFGVWKPVYKEEHKTAIESKRRERLIKSYKGGNAFRILVGLPSR